MSDDFGTVNMRASARSKEIEAVRQHYRKHREALARMAGDAPTESLAAEYNRLIASIDSSMLKLDELEGRPPAPLSPAPAPAATSPASRPLVMTPDEPMPSRSSSGSRVVLMLVIALVVLGAIGWLIWRASLERKPSALKTSAQPVPSATQPLDTGGTVSPAVSPAPASTVSIRVTPAVQDYGIIRKGTRAVQQFELKNTGSIPITIEVARSTCRCLFYEYSGKKVQPNARETITVTVDAARAKTATVNEQLEVRAKEDPSATATIVVRAAIK